VRRLELQKLFKDATTGILGSFIRSFQTTKTDQ
jgi:hypothetical protein